MLLFLSVEIGIYFHVFEDIKTDLLNVLRGKKNVASMA